MSNHHIFENGKIGEVTIKNRVVMPAMGTNLASSEGEVTDQQIAYYEERAKGGTGLITIEVTAIEAELGKATVNQLRIDDDRFVSGFSRLAKAVHKHDGKIFVQLHHAGRESYSMLTGGKQIVAPSPITCEAVGEVPRELTTEEVKDLVNKFIIGAVRCKRAGIDGVELHGAHGYLINQFLSPHTNQRTDEYGGSFENRMRFLKDIVMGIKEQCGNDFPVMVRLSVDEFEEGGMDVSLSKKVSRYLEEIGVDALHASAGNYNSIDKVVESPLFEQGWRVYLAEEIKKEVNIPVIAVGSIREPQFVNSILADGKADFVAMGRSHIADPEWTRKAMEGRDEEIRKCISCLHCTKSSNPHVSCSINVRAGREREFQEITPIEEKRHVVIVGGGPGGMEAARVLSLKGYDVTLFEKDDKLGGQLNLVSDPVHKQKTDWFIAYLSNEMERLQVDVRLNTEASTDMIESFQPYAVILATGGEINIPNIEGTQLPNVCHYMDYKTGQKTFDNKHVAVLGSGLICHSVVRHLKEEGNDVTLIELPTKSSRRIDDSTRLRLLNRLKNMNANIVTNQKVSEIHPNAVQTEDRTTGEKAEFEIDDVIIAMGVKPYNPLEEPLRKMLDNVFVIGDAADSYFLGGAVGDGFEKAFDIESLVDKKEEALEIQ
ncbi:FAD-dependent oxidoreductase [Texcoconibacillus texcoconensis]|uniref:2,4-dienoyl-CoA reductase-like NADH-dependent reductase (Old Yellow Enzyme family)/thioredoxin reductase n=1 Tax=Texcoconibacillus texcoconensis TaxID=1095777 RepID=A0A840QTQ2_9BACI|nr:FAD-dependent oxidoreductase [Texcoconibacillus texcoconensis]MBB5174647.1 2,4-dienoyl-CoA reductase-like NADH-dependent reductase (Old Yellow Enzyme family)/thioredoxin reductase [Texcoconibacillus texcoconensis]